MATQEQTEKVEWVVHYSERAQPEVMKITTIRDQPTEPMNVAKQALPIEPPAASPDITPEWLFEVGGRRLNEFVMVVGPEVGLMIVVVVAPHIPGGCEVAVYNRGARTTIATQPMTQARFQALCYGLGITLKGEGK